MAEGCAVGFLPTPSCSMRTLFEHGSGWGGNFIYTTAGPIRPETKDEETMSHAVRRWIIPVNGRLAVREELSILFWYQEHMEIFQMFTWLVRVIEFQFKDRENSHLNLYTLFAERLIQWHVPFPTYGVFFSGGKGNQANLIARSLHFVILQWISIEESFMCLITGFNGSCSKAFYSR